MKMRWLQHPEPHDYPAAIAYLTLLLDHNTAEHIVERLALAPIAQHKAKDILRASRLALLPADDPYVASDLKRARKGEKLSPVLLVRGDSIDTPLQIADGYHRVCAAYHQGEDTTVPAQIVSAEKRQA